MNFIKDVLRGMVMGVANAIPGVSGGTMAVSMGIYDKMIHALTHIFKELKKSIMTLLPIGVGMMVGIGVLSFVITAMFDHIPVQTNLLFIGLIIGSLPIITREVKGKKINALHILFGIIFFAIVVGMPIVGQLTGDGHEVAVTGSFMAYVKLILVGMVASATMIIPGVSGSMMLTVLGYYNSVMEAVKNFIKAIISLDGGEILDNLCILVPFGIGVIVGIVVVAKLIELVLDKFPTYAYSAIIGLIVGSPIAIFYEYISENGTGEIGVVSILTGIVTLAIGCVVALKLSDDKKEDKDEIEEKA